MHRVVPSTSGWHRASSGGNVAAMVTHNRHSGAQQNNKNTNTTMLVFCGIGAHVIKHTNTKTNTKDIPHVCYVVVLWTKAA